MTLQDLGNLGEFAGAIAVLASLIYLGVQVKSNTKAIRASAFLGSTNGWLDYVAFASQPELAELLVRANSEPDLLSPSELSRLYLATRGAFRRFENDYYQYRNGLFDEGTWRGYRTSLRDDFVSDPGIRAFWSLHRDKFSPEFADFVDREAEVAKAEAQRSEYTALDAERFAEMLRHETAT